MNRALLRRTSRRSLLLGSAATSVGGLIGLPQFGSAENLPAYSLPMGLPGLIPGDGCYIRRCFDCENVPYLAGWWHTGENWYLDIDGDSAGAAIYAVADGRVVFAGSDYPGRVVIIEHSDGLFSMYGHLDYDLFVSEGQSVARGTQIGTVLFKTDGRSPSHLHFEIRDFLIKPEVNGDFPSYGYACGLQCPPGPGYWPMSDSRLPVQMGWRNPLHVIYRRALYGAISDDATVAASSSAIANRIEVRATPAGEITGEVSLETGKSLRLLAVETGRELTRETSALAYQVWCEIELDSGRTGWVPAVSSSSEHTSSDGRAASIRLNLLIAGPAY